MKIERYDAVPRERNAAAAAAAAARNLSELVRETCEREVQKIKKEVGAAQSLHINLASSRSSVVSLKASRILRRILTNFCSAYEFAACPQNESRYAPRSFQRQLDPLKDL